METTTCIHHEHIESAGDDVELGTCGICHQVKRRSTIKRHLPPELIKLGRIDGRIVLPGPRDILRLSLEEADELKAAQKAPALAPAASTPRATLQPASRGKHWYQDHKKEMIEDLISLGNTAFLKKWKVKRQTVSHLKSDKLYLKMVGQEESVASPTKTTKAPTKRGKKRLPKPESHQKPSSIEDVTEAAKKGNGGQLPRFPDWAPEKWATSEIAVQWLKTYEALARFAFPLELGYQPASPEKAKKRGWFSRLFKRVGR